MSDILEGLSKWWVSGFSLLGGDPFEPENQSTVADILRLIRTYFPAINIWCYTGYLYDKDLKPGGKVYTEWTNEILGYIDKDTIFHSLNYKTHQ